MNNGPRVMVTQKIAEEWIRDAFLEGYRAAQTKLPEDRLKWIKVIWKTRPGKSSYPVLQVGVGGK